MSRKVYWYSSFGQGGTDYATFRFLFSSFIINSYKNAGFLKKQKIGYQKYSQSSEQWVSLQKNAYSPMNRPIIKNDHTVFQKNYILMTFEMISLVFR